MSRLDDDIALLSVAMTEEQTERAVAIGQLMHVAASNPDRMMWVLSRFAARAAFDPDLYDLFTRACNETLPTQERR